MTVIWMLFTWTTRKIWTLEEVGDPLGELSQEQKQVILDQWNAEEEKSGERKLAEIKYLRNQKLSETDYLALSDTTLSVAMSNYRQGMRDIPQNNNTEDAYDLILARDGDGNLTHSIWNKPIS